MEIQTTLNPQSHQKVFDVQHFCTTKCSCRQQQLADYYSWDGDLEAQPCGVCDNCVNRIKDDAQQLPDAVNDVCELVSVIQSLTTDYENVTPQDVIDVYTHAKTKDEPYIRSIPA
jgi:superfamily II DNA helicase RecQ